MCGLIASTLLLGLAPAGLASAAQLTLRWSDTAANETGFTIERASTANGPFLPIASTHADTTSYTDVALDHATTYFYRVNAFNYTGESGYSNTASATTPPPPNTAPTISSIVNQSIQEDGVLSPLPFTIGDAETAVGSLTLTVVASNTTLFPAGSITLAGTGATRTIALRPAADRSGTATITIRVSDGVLASESSFTVTVAAVNDLPVLSALSARSMQSGTSSGTIPFTVGDVETPAGSLAVSVSSSNPTLMPASAMALGGSDANRTLTLTPPPSTGGSVTVTLRVSDGTAATTGSFVVTLGAANTAPTISAVANRTVATGTSSGPIAFTIGDRESHADSLVVSATSSNVAVLPESALSLGGSGATRTLTFTPPSAPTGGTAMVTLRVSDGEFTTSTSFVVTVDATNTAPTISPIGYQSIAMNGTTGAINFTVHDTQTPAGSLTLITNASNQALVPLSNITLGGSGSERTITVRPLSNSTGWSTIWIKVSDGTLSQTISFVVNVSAVLSYEDVGAPALAGSQTITGGTIEITAGGTDIWGGTDQFRFGHQPLQGDSEMTVRVASLTRSHDWAKVGLMYRGSTDANAAFVFVCLTPTNGVALQYRTAAGVAAQQKYTTAASAPRWLKLTRSGDTFYAFHSADGVTWSLLDFVTVDLPDTAPAGLAVTSHAAATAITATFEGFTVD